MKLRIYLDTSIFSVYHDDRTPDRRDETRAFWSRLSEFEPMTSVLAREELEMTPGIELRNQLLLLLKNIELHPLTDESYVLARRYVSEGVFPAKVFNDALHVATAVLTRQDLLVSWNFKHLVNRRRRAKVNEINISLGLPAIEIVPPPEL